jgi:hypothetical protein
MSPLCVYGLHKQQVDARSTSGYSLGTGMSLDRQSMLNSYKTIVVTTLTNRLRVGSTPLKKLYDRASICENI